MMNAQMAAAKRKYSTKEIAEAMDRHVNSIRRNLQQGDLEGHKQGNEWIVTPAALRDWLGDEVFEIYFGAEEEK